MASSSGLTDSEYRAAIITPIVFTCVFILGVLIYRRKRRQRRERAAGVSRELNPETGAYEMRPMELRRVSGTGVRRADEADEAGIKPPAYADAVGGEREREGERGGVMGFLGSVARGIFGDWRAHGPRERGMG